jgi:hypothetical protein
LHYKKFITNGFIITVTVGIGDSKMVKSKQKESQPTRQGSEESPVIEDPWLPKMDEHSNRPKRIRGKIVRMPPNPSSSRAGKKLMDLMAVNKEENAVTF